MRPVIKPHLQPFKLVLQKLLRGRLSFLEMAYFNSIYFSQFGEDLFLANYFRAQTDGFYVDVGAFHPYNISNTCVFYKRGWRGINIEPNPVSFRAFPKYRRRDINLNIAVSQQDARVLLNCMKELSGIDDQTHVFRKDSEGVRQCWVQAMPLASILREHLPKGTSIDFMSVDCEGHDAEVLRSNDWNQFRPHVILVEEHARDAGKIDSIMSAVDYRPEVQLRLTKVFVEATHRAQLSPVATA